MGDHNEENVPQNPNKTEKTRFNFVPNLPADSEPVQQTDSVPTRFGMVSPTLTDLTVQTRKTKTGLFRLDGSPETDLVVNDSGYNMAKVGLVYSHTGQNTPKTSEILSIVFFRIFQATIYFLLLLVLLGLGIYFVFYDSIYPPRTTQSNLWEHSSIPPTTVRFFDLVASGRRFVFLIDTTEQMEPQTDSSTLYSIKNKLQQSLRDLKEFDFFELLCFNHQISATFGQDISVTLIPADSSHLSKAGKTIEEIQPMGSCDLKRAIFAALALKPDIIFLLCHSTNTEQLNAKVLEEIQAAADKTKLYSVEVADSIKPLHETLLEKLTQNLHGDYQWLSILQKTSQAEGLNRIQKENYENISVPPLTEMIEADFKFYSDVSRPETQKRSPFGQEIVTSSNFSSENNNLSSPKQLSISDTLIREIETDARIVYMSGLIDRPHNPPMLHVGAENRLALWIQGGKAELPAAEYLLGLCYKNGARVKSDETKAFQCQFKAALQGCQPAMFLVAMEYKTQSETNPPDQSAISYMKYWLEKGAKLGEPLAQCYWANHFTNTPEERFSWLEKAANQDLPEAQYLFGKCFETGSGTITDKSVAVIWYEKAAKQGYTAAQIAWDKLKADSTTGLGN